MKPNEDVSFILEFILFNIGNIEKATKNKD